MFKMETTFEKKSILTPNKLLTDNLNEGETFNIVMEQIAYKLKSHKTEEVNQARGDKPSFDSLFNHKITAVYKKQEFISREYYTQSHNWICHIIEINNNTFTARLDELGMENGTYEFAEFDFDEVNPEDQKLISLGSIFYWTVGRLMKGSQIVKESFIRFQRLPSWNVPEFNNVIDQSSKLRSRLKWE
jgi:hypothetical protein